MNNQCPNANRWFRRCKFQARYDIVEPTPALESIIMTQWAASETDKDRLITKSTYRGDVCVRCGRVVNEPKNT